MKKRVLHQILYTCGDFWVRKEKVGYAIFETTLTHSIEVAKRESLPQATAEAQRRSCAKLSRELGL